MQNASSRLFDRPDTLFGVCEGIGQDFGFNPLYLRIVLGVSLLWNPVAVVIAYVVLGAAVLVSRLIVPVKSAVQDAVVATPSVEAENDRSPAPTAIAA